METYNGLTTHSVLCSVCKVCSVPYAEGADVFPGTRAAEGERDRENNYDSAVNMNPFSLGQC
jgi:hypothetical protein